MEDETTTVSDNDAAPVIALDDVTKVYEQGAHRVDALRGLTMSVGSGEFTAISGPSGSGKTTALNLIGALDTPTSGTVCLEGVDLGTLTRKELSGLRRDRIGFVFQAYNLLPTLTAAENTTLPLDLAGRRPDSSWMDQVVKSIGIADRLNHRPDELSGGQQQRVAIARALVSQPEIVFADEPTGNLDSKTGEEVLDFLRTAVEDLGQTMVMVTHDAGAAARAHRVLFLADGRIVDEMVEPTPDRILDHIKGLGG